MIRISTISAVGFAVWLAAAGGCGKTPPPAAKTGAASSAEATPKAMIVEGHGEYFDVPASPASPPPRWPNREAVFAEAPDVPFVDHEFDWEGERYIVSAPADAKVEAGDALSIRIELTPEAIVRFGRNPRNMEAMQARYKRNVVTPYTTT